MREVVGVLVIVLEFEIFAFCLPSEVRRREGLPTAFIPGGSSGWVEFICYMTSSIYVSNVNLMTHSLVY